MVGPLAYEAVPGFLASHSVGFLPLSEARENLGRSPMKLYEYLASGLLVVGRVTDVLKGRGEYVRTFFDAEGAIEAMASALSENPDRRCVSNSARSHDWSEVSARLMRFLERVEQSRIA